MFLFHLSIKSVIPNPICEPEYIVGDDNWSKDDTFLEHLQDNWFVLHPLLSEVLALKSECINLKSRPTVTLNTLTPNLPLVQNNLP